MKLACLGKDFFIGSEAGWNIFDLIVVFSSVFGVVNPNASVRTLPSYGCYGQQSKF